MGTTPVTVGAANVNSSILSTDVTVYVHHVYPGATLGLTRAVDLLGTPLSDVRGMRASSLAEDLDELARTPTSHAYVAVVPYTTPMPYGSVAGLPSTTPTPDNALPSGQSGRPNGPYSPSYQPSRVPRQIDSSSTGITPVGAGAPVLSGVPGADPCYGDEQLTYAPEVPRVGAELLIAASSSRPHPYGRLIGTERTQFVRERPGQLGLVWEWTVQPSYPGQHAYTFYVDSTIPCQTIEIGVREALVTRTPRPTRTPAPYRYGENVNRSNNTNDNRRGH